MKKERADMHIHSCFSWDSKLNLEPIAEKLDKKHIGYGALTDHVEFAFQPEPEVLYMLNKRNKELAKLEGKHKVELLRGIEISEPHLYPAEMEILKDRDDLDYVLGSIHHVYGMPLKKMKDLSNCYDAYLRSVLQMVETADIDAVAHLDYIKRYFAGQFNQDVLNQVLKTIIERDLALEINTSGYRRCGKYFPSDEILETYATLGGKKIVIGSDAHHEREINENVDEARNYLTEKYNFQEGIYKKRRFRRI